MIRSEACIQISKTVSEVFAFICDFAKASTWLESCVELKQVTPGEPAAGVALLYRHKQGGREEQMDGIITAFEKDACLEMKFTDTVFEVEVAFRCGPDRAGCQVTHCISIQSKGLLSKVMSPLIRAGNAKQVKMNLSRLKQRLEERAE